MREHLEEPGSEARPSTDSSPKFQQAYEEQVSKLYAATSQILSNLRYIRDELPNVNAPTETRDTILNVCGDFEWEVLGVRMEIRRLEDNLGFHPGEEPFRHGKESDNPIETMEYIHDWLGPQLVGMHNVFAVVQAQAERDPQAGLLALLLTESATNIINEAIVIEDALVAIRNALNPASAKQAPMPHP